MEQKELTAVDWLQCQILESSINIENGEMYIKLSKDALNQAKEMEKQQIMDAWNNCLCIQDFNDKCAEYYYNETYGKIDQSFQAPRC